MPRGRPDSRFSNSNGGQTCVSSLRMSAGTRMHIAATYSVSLCRRFLQQWRLGFRQLLWSRRTNRVCGTLEPPIHLHRWSSRHRPSNISRFSVLRWALTSQLCVCCAGATLPEPLPIQRQRMTHKMPTGPGQTYLRRESREVLTILKNSHHIFSHDVPTFQHIDHNCVPEKPYGARAEDQYDSARMKRD